MRWAGVVALALAGCSAAAPDGIVRLPNGRRLHFACRGAGAPTILLEAGWTGDARGWGRVPAALAGRHRVCAYDRAGAGASDPAAGMRDPAAIARDLDDGLRAGRIAGPFVLVGHSAGALYIAAFRQRRPHAVVGMVLVDPTHPEQRARLVEAFGRGAGSLAPLMRTAARCAAEADAPLVDLRARWRCAVAPGANARAVWRTRLAELRGLFVGAAPLGPGALGALPLVVLTAGRDRPPAVRAAYRAMHRDLAAASTRGVQRDVGDAGHMMMADCPDAIVAAVDEVAR